MFLLMLKFGFQVMEQTNLLLEFKLINHKSSGKYSTEHLFGKVTPYHQMLNYTNMIINLSKFLLQEVLPLLIFAQTVKDLDLHSTKNAS